MKLFARRALAFLFWSPVLFAAAACNNQGEGERCDTTNGSTDCDQGLICTDRAYVAGAYHKICCPVPPAPITVAACHTTGGPPPDAGTSPDATSDSRAEGGADTNGNDAAAEPTDDRVTIDTTTEISRDMSADPSTPDISADRGTADAEDALDAADDLPSTPDQTSPDSADDSPIDATSTDTAPDAPADIASEPPLDAPDLDVMTPTDVGDAPAADGPG